MTAVHDINEAAGQIATERHGDYSQLTGADEVAYNATYERLCDLVNEGETFNGIDEIKAAMLKREYPGIAAGELGRRSEIPAW